MKNSDTLAAGSSTRMPAPRGVHDVFLLPQPLLPLPEAASWLASCSRKLRR
jgi:hypothetical protein